MSKRTLIIKWSIIAGLVIVLVFFATVYNNIFNSKQTAIDNTDYSNVSINTDPQLSSDSSLSDESDISKKTLTVFPKEACVKNAPLFNFVQNIGGSKNDEILSTLHIGNKYYIISQSSSTDHDFDSNSVKCLAVSVVNENGTLEKVFVIQGTDPKLLDYTVTQDGMLIAYSDSSLKLLKLSLELNCLKETEFLGLNAATADLRTIDDRIYLFTTDNTTLTTHIINTSLQVIKSKQSVYSGRVTINAVFTMSNTFKLFLNVDSGRSFIKLLELDSELDTMVLKDLSDEFSGRLISVTPFFDKTQHYALLIYSDGGTYLKVYDADNTCTNMSYICKEKNVVLINYNNTLLILGNKTAVCCCIHGDVILENISELCCFTEIADWIISDNKLLILGTDDNNACVAVNYSVNHSVISKVYLGTAKPCSVTDSSLSIVITFNSSENDYLNYGQTDGYIAEIKNEIL